ncbi:MAG TPA: SIMPL domain-containing protein [Candidatus Magasanikbacteria bacterium]|nr:SIMPL domain-containing protein [Candidatus Magasanikbacteria bacterium]
MSEEISVQGGKVIAVGMVVASLIFSIFFYASRVANPGELSVTGSARMRVTSDTVKWTVQLSRLVDASGLQRAYADLEKDQKEVQSVLVNHSIPSNIIETSQVFTEQDYSYNTYDANAPRRYTVRQTVTVQSGDIENVTEVAKNIQTLVSVGSVVSTYSLEYLYSKLPELRVNLLSDAVKDAKTRAEKIAESSGSRVGALHAASQGVVQVMAPNSVEVADYGAYDTSSIEKEVMATVRASFGVK